MTLAVIYRLPCILVRLNRAVDEFVVTGNLRFVTTPRAAFQTGRNAPRGEAERGFNWLDGKSHLQPELSDDVNDAFVFSHPNDAGAFLYHFAGGSRLMDWSTRAPGGFHRGAHVTKEFVPAQLAFLRASGGYGLEDPTPSQVWAAYRTLMRAGLAEALPEVDWIRRRMGVAP